MKQENRILNVHGQHEPCYLVQDECYTRQDETDKVESGRLVRIYAKSRFLDHISKTTGATSEWPGPLLHVEVICLNHVIDVVATKPPQIRLRGMAEAKAELVPLCQADCGGVVRTRIILGLGYGNETYRAGGL